METDQVICKEFVREIITDVKLRSANLLERNMVYRAFEACPMFAGEGGSQQRHLGSNRSLYPRSSTEFRLHVRENTHGIVTLAIHFSRSGTVRNAENTICRERRIAEKYRLASNVTQQNATRNDNHIRLAERQVAIVVERGQGIARCRIRCMENGSHARIDRDDIRANLLHQHSEQFIQQETSVEKFPLGFQGCSRYFEVFFGASFRSPHCRLVGSGFQNQFPHLRMADIVILESPPVSGDFGNVAIRLCPSTWSANRDDFLVQRVFQPAKGTQTPFDFRNLIRNEIVMSNVGNRLPVRMLTQKSGATDLVLQIARDRFDGG